jgi:hypothetical protein
MKFRSGVISTTVNPKPLINAFAGLTANYSPSGRAVRPATLRYPASLRTCRDFHAAAAPSTPLRCPTASARKALEPPLFTYPKYPI